MNKRTVLCFLIFTVCVLYSLTAQGISLAQQVLRKHNRTLQRADVQEVLPQILEGLKAPDTQALLNPQTINAVVANPNLLPIFIPDIEPRFVALLKRDQELKNFLRDPLVQRLLQSPAAIDELAGLLGIGAEFRPPDLSAREIFDQAMPSVVWIATLRGDWVGKGSGVLIDKRRRLVVTNEHVVRNTEWMAVFFPFRQNGHLVKNEDFYFNNWKRLDQQGYHTHGRVVARNVRNDLAIVQLDHLPTNTHEIKHNFSWNVEESMERGDKVHILGNPGDRLWNWTQGTFLRPQKVCLVGGVELVGCLEMEGDTHGGNSGGPVLNGQGVLIGILTGGTDETLSLASPARNVKALLSTIPANLTPVQRTYPKRVFKIRNRTGVSIHYQIRWSNSNNWQRNSLKTGYIRTHSRNGENIPQGYPKIRFDHIAGDQQVIWRVYRLSTSLQFGNNTEGALTYYFRYNHQGDRLDLYPDRDAGAAPALSKAVPEENALFANYPNPFNPETWIPYQLATPAEVKVVIYAADGTLVRTLSLGHQAAGVYQSKGRAAYWDGTNALGEPVASSVYFYTLKADNFTATRKMLIRK